MPSLLALWPRRAPALPPGQRRLAVFPRFSDDPLRPAPAVPDHPEIQVRTDDEVIATIGKEAIDEHRCEQRADLHCVTTWSVTGLRWEGAPFRALWRQHVAEHPSVAGARYLRISGWDGYAAVLTLRDALADGVMITDRLDGRSLDTRHGAPFRFVSPGQYGYKSVKHLARIELHTDRPRSELGAKEHLRARVALEERHSTRSGRLLRWPYRLLVPLTATLAERSLRRPTPERPETPSGVDAEDAGSRSAAGHG